MQFKNTNFTYLLIYPWRIGGMPCLRHPCLAMDEARIYEKPSFLAVLEVLQCLQQRVSEP